MDSGGRLKLKQYGAYRTCTNVVNVWLSAALGVPIRTNTYGHKHSRIDPEQFPGGSLDGFGFLVSLKDPYAWVQSFARWRGAECDFLFAVRAVQYWNEIYSHWFEVLASRPLVVVPFERLLSEPDRILCNVCKEFDMEVVGPMDVPRTVVAPNETPTDELFEPSWYTERKYVAALDRSVYRILRAGIDWDRISEYGYER